MFNKNKISIILNVILLIIIIFCIKECSRKDNIISDKNTLLQKSKYDFDTLRDSKGYLLAKQKANIFMYEYNVEKLLDTIETLSKIKQQIKVETQTIIREVPLKISHIDTIRINDSLYINLPFSCTGENEWYYLKTTVDTLAQAKIDSLNIKNNPSFYYGYDKWKVHNLWKKREPVIVYKDKNPYIKVLSIDNIIIKEKRKPFTIGVQTGYGITKNGLSPYLGLGVQFNLN